MHLACGVGGATAEEDDADKDARLVACVATAQGIGEGVAIRERGEEGKEWPWPGI